jgi:hypothetical protein
MTGYLLTDGSNVVIVTMYSPARTSDAILIIIGGTVEYPYPLGSIQCRTITYYPPVLTLADAEFFENVVFFAATIGLRAGSSEFVKAGASVVVVTEVSKTSVVVMTGVSAERETWRFPAEEVESSSSQYGRSSSWAGSHSAGLSARFRAVLHVVQLRRDS